MMGIPVSVCITAEKIDRVRSPFEDVFDDNRRQNRFT